MDLRTGQAGDEVGLRAGAGGRDHLRAACGGELHRQRTHPAAGPGDQHRLALGQADRVQAHHGSQPRHAQRARVPHRQALGDTGDAVSGGHGDVLGQRTGAQVRLQHEAEDLVADREAVHALTERLDGAREVSPEDQREPVLHEPLRVPGSRGDVEAVQRGGGHLDQQFTGSRARSVHLGHSRGRGDGFERDGTHDNTLSEVSRSKWARRPTFTAATVQQKTVHPFHLARMGA
ncbi:hypothetical protein PV379_06665 [Streptomyces caniscabiei]|nr:hypothetical protein [Streptomyces caniscabiei]MDX2604254.1 hypothetical protein [Streptomyces caniscabiei]MDX2735596.1 hypothetical protein [Streptomyces caniscabiei]MDX2777001.1 hypothetical protein [Streptomyces caniscabiei]